MSVKPILFNTDMVRAILDGRKTITRQVIKPQPDDGHEFFGINCMDSAEFVLGNHCCEVDLPYLPGDVLWVRETWWQTQDGKFHYLADYELPELTRKQLSKECKARPSIHMPREAARIFLRVKDVRVERLQEITASGSLSEGVKLILRSILEGAFPLAPFAHVWDSTIKSADLPLYSWAANPWVWVIEFEQCEMPDEWCKNENSGSL